MKKIASKNFFPIHGDAQFRKITFISTSLAYAFSIAVAVVENALGKRYDESSNLLPLLNYLRGVEWLLAVFLVMLLIVSVC